MIGRSIHIHIRILDVEVGTYSSLIVVAIIAGVFAWWWPRRRERPLALYFVAAAVIYIPAQLTANLFASLEHPGSLAVDVLLGRQGSTFVGGLFGGVLAFCLAFQAPAIRRLFGRPWSVLDQIASALPLSMAIGRAGCFLAGDGCYGPPTSLPWGAAFPRGVVPSDVPVHPTMVYEAAILLAYFAAVHLRSWQQPPPDSGRAGIRFGIFLAFYGSERFLIEFWRVNATYAGLSQAQWLSLLLIAASAATLAFRNPQSIDLRYDRAGSIR